MINTAIYSRLCENYDLKPEECLFVDDNAANIEAAKAFGLHAIRFEGYEKSYDVVMKYLEKSVDGHIVPERKCERTWNMKYKCCVFDLDGTLVNSIHALTYCTNRALERCGVEQKVTEAQMMTIVGDGYKTQMRRSLIACGDTELVHYEEILPIYMEVFAEHCLYEMRAYKGIPELLKYAKDHGIKIAVVSNKPHAQAVDTTEFVFGKGYFDCIIGEKEGIPKKPDPTMAINAAKELGFMPEQCIYFGDTNTDMQTGTAAGMTTVGVLWGFRGREELEQFFPDYLIESPAEMITILEKKK